ncbi:hypothetical protein RB620_02520 [Paenibacillus sp. LHD-117]|uniref:hypothetical protein n=1 Tax=Paenibacillus sp. LHD-117 TaxID=3071412 RepID=UPI0027DF4803|nr:hypothetical protein [Paenibacillus sp. LHD-117]MDQ6418303.1 hypothetical protein [Paenibacillus sp. LHD-117]
MTDSNDHYTEQAFSSPPPHQEGPLKHSGLGIASFVISLVALLLIVIGIIIAATNVSGMMDDESMLTEIERITQTYEEGQEAEMGTELLESEEFGGAIMGFMAAGLMMLASIALAFVGLILGIIGVASKLRRKTFGVIGLVLNALILLGTVGLFIASFAIGAMNAV